MVDFTGVPSVGTHQEQHERVERSTSAPTLFAPSLGAIDRVAANAPAMWGEIPAADEAPFEASAAWTPAGQKPNPQVSELLMALVDWLAVTDDGGEPVAMLQGMDLQIGGTVVGQVTEAQARTLAGLLRLDARLRTPHQLIPSAPKGGAR